jgi:LysR family nitrogen assimilation transcriptional regulator
MFLVAGADTWHGKIGSNGVAKTPITWADCAKLDLILPSRTHRFHAMLESQGQRRSLSFEPVLEVDSLAEMRDLVIRGSGYTILTRAAAGSAVDQGTLVLVPIVQPALRRMLYFVWDARRVATLSVGTVRRVMKEVTCELVEKGRWQGNLTEDAFAA